uniref:Uncharacterized protein n=1 Tax=Klebsiella pneumoniae TaxID=573 RepID=A0A8B0SW39_KLEPN|nr:hypothetical protein [Klebsiella pneumoniae]
MWVTNYSKISPFSLHSRTIFLEDLCASFDDPLIMVVKLEGEKLTPELYHSQKVTFSQLPGCPCSRSEH